MVLCLVFLFFLYFYKSFYISILKIWYHLICLHLKCEKCHLVGEKLHIFLNWHTIYLILKIFFICGTFSILQKLHQTFLYKIKVFLASGVCTEFYTQMVSTEWFIMVIVISISSISIYTHVYKFYDDGINAFMHV